jgi:hypothetical protein
MRVFLCGACLLASGLPTLNPIPLKAFAPVSFPTLSYDQWMEGFPAFTNNAPDADADGDGISNLMEYFQGSDPTEPGLFETNTTNVTATETLFTYRQSERISGVTAQVEWSTDLQTWNVDGVTTDPPQDVGGHLEFTAHVPRAGEQVMFTRLRVTLNQARSANGMPAETAKASPKAHDDASPALKMKIPLNPKAPAGKLSY